MKPISQQKTKVQKILFLGKDKDQQVYGILQDILQQMNSYRFFRYYFMDEQFLKFTKQKFPNLDPQQYSPNKEEMQVDYIVTIGGDGTILRAVGLFQNRPTPKMITFQKGTLGFLCKFELEDLQPTINNFMTMLSQLDTRKFYISRRMRLQCTLTSNFSQRSYHCINQVSITKSNQNNQLKLDIYVGDKPLTSVSGDGFLISTPTGSTAYSLSAGGPIVHSSLRAMILVPVSPSSLSFRPVVLPTKLPLRIKLAKGSRNDGIISLDGQVSWTFCTGDELMVQESGYDAQFLTPMDEGTGEEIWTQKLKKLLHWNTLFSLGGERLSKL